VNGHIKPKQELAMSRSFAQASILAMTLGIAALGPTLTPAAALTHPGSLSERLPSLPVQTTQTAPGASLHPSSSTIHLPQITPTASGGSAHPGSTTVLPTQTPHPGISTVQPTQTPHPGISKIKLPEYPMPGSGPTPLPHPVDDICPFNKLKCPPKDPNGPGTAGNPQGLGGQTYPSGGPVVIVAPSPVFQAPVPVYQAPVPVYQDHRPVVTATNAPAAVTKAPCNCLTKQYLSDGSVLFQDICTRETAMATPDELRAQAQAAAPTVR
jgi:hypothetical protein